MTFDRWTRRKVRDFAVRSKVVNSEGALLPPLSITKGRGVVLQSEKYKKQIATDLRKYIIARRGQFAFDPMSLYYGAIGQIVSIEVGLVSPDYVVFDVDDTVDKKFMNYLFRSPLQVAKYEKVAETGNQFGKRRRVYWSVFEDLEVALPPLDQQQEIATVLSSVDEAIEATQAVIKQTQTVEKAVMAELLTRGLPNHHIRFKPLSDGWRIGRVEPNINEIPESWELVSILSVARLESGHTPSRRHPEYWAGTIPWISLHDSKSLDEPELSETAQTIGPLGIANSSARLLPKGSVVFSRTATVGKVTIMGREMATSQDFANYICEDRLYNKYLRHLLRHMQTEWSRLMSGSTHQTIYMPVFRDLKILLPPIEEQRKIAAVADVIQDRLSAESQQLLALMNLKSALASVLLNGDVRINMEADAA